MTSMVALYGVRRMALPACAVWLARCGLHGGRFTSGAARQRPSRICIGTGSRTAEDEDLDSSSRSCGSCCCTCRPADHVSSRAGHAAVVQPIQWIFDSERCRHAPQFLLAGGSTEQSVYSTIGGMVYGWPWLLGTLRSFDRARALCC